MDATLAYVINKMIWKTNSFCLIPKVSLSGFLDNAVSTLSCSYHVCICGSWEETFTDVLSGLVRKSHILISNRVEPEIKGVDDLLPFGN